MYYYYLTKSKKNILKCLLTIRNFIWLGALYKLFQILAENILYILSTIKIFFRINFKFIFPKFQSYNRNELFEK